MIQAFFAFLIIIIGISFTIYSFFYEKKNLILVSLFILFSVLSLFFWQVAILVILPFIFYKKYHFGQFITLNMFAAALLSWFYLNLFFLDLPFTILIAIISLIVLCSLAILGIFENDIRSYLLLSNAIQILFVIVDLSVANFLGEFGPLITIQIFNYTFAGLVFFLTIGMFGRNKKYVYELEGSLFASRWNDVFATIACLSLAGLPAFNMFVSEWLMFIKSFSVTPVITILGIFAALLLFIMYYKVIYFLLIGKTRKKDIPQSMTLLNGTLAIICLLLGFFPHVQLEILSRLVV